jgi:hypothetical protein
MSVLLSSEHRARPGMMKCIRKRIEAGTDGGHGCRRTPNMNLTVASSGVSNDDFAFSRATMSACLSASLAIVGGAAASLSSCSVKSEVAIETSEFARMAQRRGKGSRVSMWGNRANSGIPECPYTCSDVNIWLCCATVRCGVQCRGLCLTTLVHIRK